MTNIADLCKAIMERKPLLQQSLECRQHAGYTSRYNEWRGDHKVPRIVTGKRIAVADKSGNITVITVGRYEGEKAIAKPDSLIVTVTEAGTAMQHANAYDATDLEGRTVVGVTKGEMARLIKLAGQTAQRGVLPPLYW